MTQNLAKLINKMGGGLEFVILLVILIFFPTTLKSIELTQICTSGQQCEIKNPQSKITNHSIFKESNDGIKINAKITTFINYGTITKTGTGNQSIKFESAGHIVHFINYGSMDSSFWVANSAPGLDAFSNYGTLKGGLHNETSTTILNNLGSMGWWMNNGNISVSSKGKVLIANYALTLNENAAEFNKFSGSGDKNSHLVINGTGVTFKDVNSKMILDFGENFEFGVGYAIGKIATNTSGATYSALGVEFDRLTPKNDIYTLYKQGDYFIARLQPQHSVISNISKSNIRTMNNFWTLSNSMIYPRKHNFVILRERSDRRISNIADSAFFAESNIKSNEIFFYRNEAINRRIQRQNKRNYSRKSLKTQNLGSSSLRADSQNLRGNPNLDSANRTRESQNLAQNPHDYYFILTPFVNHNYFFESGRYNLSGFDYGFLTAFSARVAESNSLGAHFAISYGSLGDSKDKDFSIKTLNLNFGLNYKLDLVYDMFLKARGDFYYFFNQAKTLTMFEAIKPNNLGFGASVSYGKDFDFKSGGILGIEVGLDYKALQSSTISLHDNVYQKALYNLIYADFGVSYSKYFGNFGLNAGLGIKGNITANKLAKSQIRINNLNHNVDMVLDNDNFLGYANLGASYVLNARDFDMEFSLAYYGNFGDRIISNAGGFEWRVYW